MTMVWAVAAFLASGAAAEPPAALRLPEHCILSAVAAEMGVTLQSGILPPVVRFESRTPLKYFQDAIEPQWGFRPSVFANAYVPTRDEIFLIDDSAYYRKMNRLIDDSLAHEYAHFIQVRYRGARFDMNDDTLEAQAIHVQTAVRNRLQAGDGPRQLCPSR